MYQILGLDFDGVVVDSNNIKDAAFLALFGKDPKLAVIQQYQHSSAALSRFVKLEYIASEILNIADVAGFVAEKAAEYGVRVREEVGQAGLITGAVEFLSSLPTGFPVHLISATPQDDLDWIVDHKKLRSHFVSVRGAPRKKSSHLQDLMLETGVPASEILYVGDAPSDAREAELVGVPFIGKFSGTDFPPGTEFYSDFVRIRSRLLG